MEEPRTQKSMCVTPYTCLSLSKMLVLLKHYTSLQLTFRLFWIICSVTEIITLLKSGSLFLLLLVFSLRNDMNERSFQEPASCVCEQVCVCVSLNYSLDFDFQADCVTQSCDQVAPLSTHWWMWNQKHLCILVRELSAHVNMHIDILCCCSFHFDNYVNGSWAYFIAVHFNPLDCTNSKRCVIFPTTRLKEMCSTKGH